MMDFSDIYDRFAAIKKALAELENRMLNDNGRLAAADHSVILRTVRMAETEAQSVLVQILRMRGNESTVRRHGQDAAVSWSAGIDPSSGQVAMVTTDVFANVTETYLMPPEQFDRLVEYFEVVRQQLNLPQTVGTNPR